MKDKGSISLILVIIVLLFVGLSVWVFKTKEPTKAPTQTPSLTPQSSAPQVVPTKNKYPFLKRQFNLSDKFHSNLDYPPEVIKVPEENLVSLSCSNFYLRNESDYFTYNDNNQRTKLDDLKLLVLIKYAQDILPDKTIDGADYCDSQNSQIIVLFETFSEGQSDNVAYFGLANSNLTIKKIFQINNTGVKYFGCSQVLELTTANILYAKCGGDGTGAVFKLNLNNFTSLPLIECFDKNPNKNVNCKN